MKSQQVDRGAIYCRISRDSEGQGLGVSRQERACREWAERNGWNVSAVFADNDISGFKSRSRPGYEGMLATVERGEVDGLLAWAPDRFTRRVSELEYLVEVIETANIPVSTVQSGRIDLSTPGGRLTARTLGSIASYESELKSERSRAKHQELRETGRAPGGSRCFGLAEGRTAIVEDEARWIRSAAAKILSGTSIRSVTREWNAAGVRTTTGRTWYQLGIRRVLLSDWVAGKRGDVPAQWPAILDEVTHNRLRLLLKDPSRTRETGPKTLLSGIAHCGLCGQKLVSQPKSRGIAAYTCRVDLGGCGKIRIKAEELEEDLLGRMWALIDPARVLAHIETADVQSGDEQALDELQERSAMLTEMLGAGELSRDDYKKAKARVDAEIAGVSSRIVRDVEAEAVARRSVDLAELESRWDKLDDIDEKRAYLRLVFERIEIGPAVRGRNFYSPDRLRVKSRV